MERQRFGHTVDWYNRTSAIVSRTVAARCLRGLTAARWAGVVSTCRGVFDVQRAQSGADCSVFSGPGSGRENVASQAWTHQHCAEWRDPNGSSHPIEYEALARAVGFDEVSAQELAAQIQSEQEIDRLFAAL